MYKDNYYAILGVRLFSSQEDVRKAYLNLAKIHHPDYGGNENYMRLINEAYEVLRDPAKKKEYDERLLKLIREDINKNTAGNTANQQARQDRQYQIHLLTIEGKVVHQYVYGSKFKFDYTKYLDEFNELYFYETREGSKISTVITYKNTWLNMVKSQHAPPPENTTSTTFSWFKIIAFFFIGICFIAMISYCDNGENELDKYVYATTHPSATPTPIPTPTPEPQELPNNGYIFKEPSQERVAPFKIDATQTPSNYYVVLKYNGEDRSRDMVFFVRGNDTLEIDVPLGTYELMYCSGSTWYGQEDKFLNMSYQKAEDLFEFYTEGNYVYYETITLYPVSNGNLEFDTIDPEEFEY